MMKLNKKYLFSVLLVLIVAISLSAISAADDNVSDVNSVSDADTVDPVSVGDSPVVTADATNSTISAGSDYATINKTFEDAADGSTVYFENGTYEFRNQSINIVSKNLNIVGNGATLIGYSTSTDNFNLFNVDSGSVNFTGLNIRLVDVSENASNNATGYGIKYMSAYDSVVSNCNFYYGSVPVYYQGSSNMTLTGNTFTGTAVVVQKNGKESGTKGTNIMGTHDILVENNTFYGNLLDGISIASNSYNANFVNNRFINNTYGIFFGGGVNYVTIVGNYFENCYGQSISNAKSQSNRLIANNTFILKNASAPAIYVELGNTAHGTPTSLSNFTVINNKFIGNNSNVPTLAVEIDSKSGTFIGPGFYVSNNTVSNNTLFLQFVDENSTENHTNASFTIDIPQTPVVEYYNITDLNNQFAYGYGQQFKVLLKDSTNSVVPNAKVAITVSGKTYYKITNEFGIAVLNINLHAGTYNITYAYGNETSGSDVITVYKASATLTPTTLTVKKGKNLVFTLKDRNGKVLSNYKVTYVIAGKSYTRTTNSKGQVSLKINLSPKNYVVTAYLNNNRDYYAPVYSGTLKVTK
ncbi:MAG: right-handed parallel beta-helix repeat-containing protein [Methanobrevibacter boviskoreani]|jgi:hypothetical protein|uniref:right-handed parallel beta-helix repeat-containing protein n=1 Tax=Methanobrevibacter boviskoreani TaxID=1348249 RepID=UPI003D924200